MILRLMSLLSVAVLTTGLVLAQDSQPGSDEPPVRLKKKHKPNAGEKPKSEPGPKEEQKKPPAKAKDKEPPAPPDSTLPAQPEINEQEVLNRVARTLQSVEQKLARNDLGESTRQAQEDVVQDLEKLIQHAQQPPQDQGDGGGAQQQQPQDNQQGQQGQQRQSGGHPGAQNSKQKGGGGQGIQPSSRQQRRERRQARGRGRGQQLAQGQPGTQPGSQRMPPGNQAGGKGGKGGLGTGVRDKDMPKGPPNRSADLYKDAWGNLPESLRAEMRAYSNPEPFLDKYDDLIRKYYRTLAEQGRKKGTQP